MRSLRRSLTKLALAVAALAAIALPACASERAAETPPEPAPQATRAAQPGVDASPRAPRSELAAWTDRQLAAQLVFCSVPATDPLAGRRFARMGVGGIVILGGGADGGIADALAALQRAAPRRIEPFIASDEEGGRVQRLRDVIYPLPSAREMGGWSISRTKSAARDYGARLRALHVSVVFGPVADLDVPGRFMSSLDRCYSADPDDVGDHVAAWVAGLGSSRVLAAVKHWPGHGWASNTHGGAGRLPALSVLRRREMVPFERAFAAGVPMVMVGHLQSRGLTEAGTTASHSPGALRYLRSRVGDGTVIITDSLSMGATTSALGIKAPASAVRALKAGADLALVCSGSPPKLIAAVTAAIRSGELPREQAEESVLRILDLKRASGLAP
jgi:beta-N-acetylhexosaminidase